MLQHSELSSKEGGDLPFRDMYTLANDASPSNDPYIGSQIMFKLASQKIPGPAIVILSAIKEWNELKKLGNGFTHFFFL